MGLTFWMKQLAKVLIASALFLLVIRMTFQFGRDFGLLLAFVIVVDCLLYFRAPYPERGQYRFEWFPVGDGFYAWWKTRKRGEEKKWTI